MKTYELVSGYRNLLGDPHGKVENIFSIKALDFNIRKIMSKVKGNNSMKGYASHFEILKRQRNISKDDLVCRRCLKDLSIVGEGRYNDFLVIRAKDCTQPICLSCSKNNPDNYHIKFLEAINKFKTMQETLNDEGTNLTQATPVPSGKHNNDFKKVCLQCNGTGIMGNQDSNAECDSCHGTGKPIPKS